MLAGYAAADITPPVGAALDGFIARLSPSSGVDAPLCARALWLEDGHTRALLVALDLLGLTPVDADRLVRSLADRLSLPEDNVILACTHTHSGPMTLPIRGLGPADEAYLAGLAESVLAAAAQASASKCPVRASWGTAPVSLGVNRRQKVPGNGVVLGFYPDGPADAAVRVLRLVGGGHSILLFAHACHPYCLGAECSLISPDFCGHAAAALAEQGHDSLYLNGCAGDISPLRPYEGPAAARAEGRRLADAVVKSLAAARPEAFPALRIGSRRCLLPLDAVPPPDALARALDGQDRTVRDAERGSDEVRDRLQRAGRDWLSDLRQTLGGGASLPPVPARLSVLRIGRGGLIALPGEVFFDLGARLAARLDADPVCVAAYVHGYIGYVPTRDAYADGGYEVDEAHRYLGLWRLAPEAGEMLVDEAARLWRGLAGRNDSRIQ